MGKTNTTSNQVRAGGRVATARASINTRVLGPGGPLGLVSDVVAFPGLTGTWSAGDRRVSVHGIPTVSTASIGLATGPDSSHTMRVVAPNARVRSR